MNKSENRELPTIVCTGPIGDVARAILAPHAKITVCPDESDETLLSMLDGAVGLVVRGGGNARSRIIEGGKALKVIGRSGTGCDTVDLEAATRRGIPVVYAPGQNARAVAEGAFALILALTKKLTFWHERMKQGDWNSRLREKPGDLEGSTLGIIGLGNSGRVLARLAGPFDLKVLAFDPYVLPVEAEGLKVELTNLEGLLRRSQIISLHIPLTAETKGLINKQTIGLISDGSILVNMARGAIVESLDLLLEGLEEGRLAGVGLDVFDPEPPDASHPIFRHPNCLASPHSLALTDGAMNRIYKTMAEGMAAVLTGRKPEFIANPEVYDQRKESN
jgi:phosphoglycerate dehydrogenase-like enzyme